MLGAELGERLGGGAHVRALRRQAIGSFAVTEAHRLDELGADDVLPPVDALRHLDRVVVDGEVTGLIAVGLPLDRVSLGALGDGPWAMVDEGGQLLAVYEATATNRRRAGVVLAAR